MPPKETTEASEIAIIFGIFISLFYHKMACLSIGDVFFARNGRNCDF